MALLTDDEIRRGIAGTAWRHEDGRLVREAELADFAAAMAYAARVGEAAEAAGHHPDILVHGYRHVRLTLWTHVAGGITGADIALARSIDRL